MPCSISPVHGSTHGSTPLPPRLPMDPFLNIATHLYDKFQEQRWIDSTLPLGAVSVRVYAGSHITVPSNQAHTHAFRDAVVHLNCEAAAILNSTLIRGFIAKLGEGTSEVAFSASDRVQVVECIEDLRMARQAQQAAFVRREQVLVVWADEVYHLHEVASSHLRMILHFVMDHMSTKGKRRRDRATRLWELQQDRSLQASRSSLASLHSRSDSGHTSLNEAELADAVTEKASIAQSERLSFDEDDGDKEALISKPRPTVLLAPLIHGLGLAVNIFSICKLVAALVARSILDGHYTRMAFLAVLPALFCLSAFLFDRLVCLLFFLIGPVKQMKSNSRYYSAIPPQRITSDLPHISVLMPVYKESIDGVIAPSIESIQACIRKYELQGGTASIIVADDGFNVLPLDQQFARLKFYDEKHLAWVARPAHGQQDYLRLGRFKKASNLNFALHASMQVEARLAEEYAAHQRDSTTSATRTSEMAADVLPEILAGTHVSARGRGDIRIGELVLLVDSDTRVPEDCLWDAASEMHASPEVAVLQHCSGIMVTDGNYFEQGIAMVYKLINFSISHLVSCGDVAPFMGHNAFLRWSALKSVVHRDDVEPDVDKIFSDRHVSEDMEIALRLLAEGLSIRWATYSRDEFLEGVSLTAEDEINRWQKYAFGASELMINELRHWFTRGPINKTMRRFLASDVPIHYKYSLFTYLVSFHALASTLPFACAYYLIWGWFAPVLDLPLYSIFEIWVTSLVVFNIGGSAGTMLGRIRCQSTSTFGAIVETIKWLPFMVVFFTGLGWHVLMALLAHPLGFNMTWEATVKDMEVSNFWIELPRTVRRYWVVLLVALAMIGSIVMLATGAVPMEYTIDTATLIVPPAFLAGAHVLFPIVLNPGLLRFSF